MAVDEDDRAPLADASADHAGSRPNGSGSRPNVVLITLDQFRADHLGCAGHPHAVTPALDALAASGVRFSNHFANCTPCAPSRASLLTGLWQMNHRVTDNGAPLRDDLPMLPRLMRDAGYDTALFGYSDTALDPATLDDDDPRRRSYEQPMDGFEPVLVVDDQIGPWVEWLTALGHELPDPSDNRSIYRPTEVETPADRGATWAPARYPAEHSEAAFLTAGVLDWLNDRGEPAGPFFAHVSYLRPHPPYIAPEPYNDMFDPTEMIEPVRAPTKEQEAQLHPFLAAALQLVPAPDDDLDQRQLQATYLGMIAEVDHQVGVLLDGLAQMGLADDTIIVLTSDHGEQLGDHWLVEKLGFFDQSFRIPLIIRVPGDGWNAGAEVDRFTENVDITPTVLDLCGVERPDWADGGSLRPLLESAATGSDDPRPEGWWRDAVHYEYDFRMPQATFVEDLLGLRQDQCTMATIRDHAGKYVHMSGGLPPLFFDLETDPEELVNLAGVPGHETRVLEYAQRLLTMRTEHLDPRYANTRATAMGTLHRADPPRESRRP